MIRRPPRSTRTDTLFPYTTLFRAGPASVALCHAQDLRRDEHQQLGLFLGARLALEQVAQERDVAEERDLGHVVAVLELVDTADHHRLAVVDQHRGVDLAAGDGGHVAKVAQVDAAVRSEEHTSELPSLMRISYA